MPDRERWDRAWLAGLAAAAAFVGASVPRDLFPLVLLAIGLGVLVWVLWPDRRARRERGLAQTLGTPGSGAPFEVHAIISDVDGVLTDGTIHRLSDGSAMRSFHTHDGMGHKRLVAAGVKVAWLSGTTERESIVGRARMVRLDESLVDTGEGDKDPRFERLCRRLGVDPDRVVYLGDDVNDLPAMERAGLAACPADAHPDVRARATIVLTTPGGRGALRELADAILSPERG